MSRRRYEDDWERRKEHLNRNLFQEVPILTPVREEEESFESLTSHAYPASAVIRERPNSPCSPLPPLIIEREPNKHDDPEEYYKILEKKMKKIYRRLFIEDRSDISEISYSDMSTPDPFTNNLPKHRRVSFGEISNDVRNDNLETDDIDKQRDENEMSSESISIDELPQDSLTPQDKNGSEANKSEPDINVLERSSSTEILPRSTTTDKLTDVEKDRSASSEIVPNINDGVESYVEDFSNNDNTFAAISYERGREKDTSSASDISTESSGASCSAGYNLITFSADVHRNPEELIITRNSVEQIAEGYNDDSNKAKNVLEKLKENYVSDTEYHTTSSEDGDTQQVEVRMSTSIYRSIGSSQIAEGNIINDELDRAKNGLEQLIENYDTENHTTSSEEGDPQQFEVRRSTRIYRSIGSSQIAEGNIINDELDKAKNGLEQLIENYVSDTENHTDTSAEIEDPQPIEVMRSTRNYPSTGSQHMIEPSDDSISNHDIIERPRSLEAHTEIDSSEETAPIAMDFEESIDYDALHTSLINQEKSYQNVCQNNGTRKRKGSCSPSHPGKRMRYEDVSV